MQIWENNYPFTLCEKSIKKRSFRKAIQGDFEKFFQETKLESKNGSNKNYKYSYYVHLKQLKYINLGNLRSNKNNLVNPDEFFVSKLKSKKLLDNSIFTLYRFIYSDDFSCPDPIPSQNPRINNLWTSVHSRLTKND